MSLTAWRDESRVNTTLLQTTSLVGEQDRIKWMSQSMTNLRNAGLVMKTTSSSGHQRSGTLFKNANTTTATTFCETGSSGLSNPTAKSSSRCLSSSFGRSGNGIPSASYEAATKKKSPFFSTCNDNLRSARVNLWLKATADDRAQYLDPIEDKLSSISRPGLESHRFAERVPYEEPIPIYVATASTTSHNHPELLRLEAGDLVVKKFNPKGNFAEFVFEKEEYISKHKFPHLSRGAFEHMQGDVFIYVRKLGATSKTGVRATCAFDKVPSATVGASQQVWIDSQEGFVPMRILENRGERSRWRREKDAKVVLEERCAGLSRFCLP